MHLSSHPRDPNLPVTASASRERDPSLPPNGAELPPPPTRPADHTHPASLDNALQLAAARATAASDRSLLVPAAFSAFAAPRANSGVARLRASADVCKGEETQSQWSNHALMGSSGVLLARVKGLDLRAMRRGTVSAREPAARQRETDVPGRRAIMYRLESLAAGPCTPIPCYIIPTLLEVHQSVYPNTLAASSQPHGLLKVY